jgi:hypothetical protein
MSLIEQYKIMHEDENLYVGSATTLHKESIGQYLLNTKSKTILDYGCGKAVQYFKEDIHNTHFFGIMPSLYDPAVQDYSILPEGTFDTVICTDVLEHIEEEDVEYVIKEIYSKADKFVYLGICNSPADSFLPDGRNSHVTQKPLEWWRERIEPHATVFTLLFVYGNNGKSKAFIKE